MKLGSRIPANGHPIGAVRVGGLFDQHVLVPQACLEQVRSQGRAGLNEHFHAAGCADHFQRFTAFIRQMHREVAPPSGVQVSFGNAAPPIEKDQHALFMRVVGDQAHSEQRIVRQHRSRTGQDRVSTAPQAMSQLQRRGW